MKNENKGDIMLGAICVDNQQDEESIMIASHDEKLRCWKLENIGIDTFQKPSDVMDAFGGNRWLISRLSKEKWSVTWCLLVICFRWK